MINKTTSNGVNTAKIITIIFLIVIAGLVGVIFTNQGQEETPSDSALNENSMANSTDDSKLAEKQDGLSIEILKPGTGDAIRNGDKATVHYIGTLEDGTKFDSSVDRGTPFIFTLGAGQVIQGWDMGVLGMKIGEKRKLTIASDLAYGPNGIPGAIPPNATLIFEVELLGIN